MQATDIDLCVMLLGFAGMFAICSGMMYLILLFGFAWLHKCNGYTIIESLEKARKELA